MTLERIKHFILNTFCYFFETVEQRIIIIVYNFFKYINLKIMILNLESKFSFGFILRDYFFSYLLVMFKIIITQIESLYNNSFFYVLIFIILRDKIKNNMQ